MGEGSTATPIIDMSGLENNLSLTQFGDVIESILPLVAIAILVGFVFYVVRFAIGLFRGV